jgi:hypothetical protein
LFLLLKVQKRKEPTFQRPEGKDGESSNKKAKKEV